jgi:hypothetical protein
MAPNVRKNAAHKESSREKSHVHRAKFNGRQTARLAGGKMAQPRVWARSGFYRRGRLRKLVHVRESLVGVGCLRAWEFVLGSFSSEV